VKRLENKIAIVTGSSSGIGKAIALRFAEEGATVVIAARRIELCDQGAATIRARGGQAAVIQTDVTDEAQVTHLISETVRQFGKIDILVNNAGILLGEHIVETATDTFDHVMNTNLRGMFFCCREGVRVMKQSGGGNIINMSSVAGVESWSGTGTYSASKFGILGLTQALADEGRPHKIRVAAICPGRVADELVDASREEREKSGLIDPFDIAETAVYLATLGPNAIVHRLVVDRMWADWGRGVPD
tara:strand:- start:1591 stop:2328 length:738 start_codon:yes stop_codon:yes gene_type:complete